MAELKSQHNNLPAKPYRRLIGRDGEISYILSVLNNSDGDKVVTIDGMGGIGKTALAYEVAIHCIEEKRMDLVIWEQRPITGLSSPDEGGRITFETILDSIARQLDALEVFALEGKEKESRIGYLLENHPILLVVDDLDTSEGSHEYIADHLTACLSSGKALLISRHRLSHKPVNVHLTGLDRQNAFEFLLNEARDKNISNIISASFPEIDAIVDSTGGSPLALKFVAGQLASLPLKMVLTQLREIRLPKGEASETEFVEFYRLLFVPEFNLLSTNAKLLLTSLGTFSPEAGGTLSALKAVSNLPEDVLVQSTDELWRSGFIEITDRDQQKPRFHLHRLTWNFVRSDIVEI